MSQIHKSLKCKHKSVWKKQGGNETKQRVGYAGKGKKKNKTKWRSCEEKR